MIRRLWFAMFAAVVSVAPAAHAALVDPNKTLQQNLEAFYPVAVNLVIFLAFLGVIYAGYIYITSQGQPDRINEAKAWIVAAVTGVVLILLVPVIINELCNLKLPGGTGGCANGSGTQLTP